MFDSKRKERLQKSMIKDTPFFVKKAIPVITQNVANRDAKVNSALLNARQRFEKQLLAEKQQDLDHEKMVQQHEKNDQKYQKETQRRHREEKEAFGQILQQQMEMNKLKRDIENQEAKANQYESVFGPDQTNA